MKLTDKTLSPPNGSEIDEDPGTAKDNNMKNKSVIENNQIGTILTPNNDEQYAHNSKSENTNSDKNVTKQKLSQDEIDELIKEFS